MFDYDKFEKVCKILFSLTGERLTRKIIQLINSNSRDNLDFSLSAYIKNEEKKQSSLKDDTVLQIRKNILLAKFVKNSRNILFYYLEHFSQKLENSSRNEIINYKKKLFKINDNNI